MTEYGRRKEEMKQEVGREEERNNERGRRKRRGVMGEEMRK